MTAIWVWHIIAGLLGALFSVSIFYQRLEKAFRVYRPVAEADVVHILRADGSEMSIEERVAFVAWYNQLSFMGRSGRPCSQAVEGVRVLLKSGERLHIVKGTRFLEVKRTKKNQRNVCFQLFDKDGCKLA